MESTAVSLLRFINESQHLEHPIVGLVTDGKEDILIGLSTVQLVGGLTPEQSRDCESLIARVNIDQSGSQWITFLKYQSLCYWGNLSNLAVSMAPDTTVGLIVAYSAPRSIPIVSAPVLPRSVPYKLEYIVERHSQVPTWSVLYISSPSPVKKKKEYVVPFEIHIHEGRKQLLLPVRVVVPADSSV